MSRPVGANVFLSYSDSLIPISTPRRDLFEKISRHFVPRDGENADAKTPCTQWSSTGQGVTRTIGFQAALELPFFFLSFLLLLLPLVWIACWGRRVGFARKARGPAASIDARSALRSWTCRSRSSDFSLRSSSSW
ncbi:MAG: hypothetical protein UU40_C0001G0030 [Candidatus Uhrbacteria bacterium GW2011_GWD2_41_121]|uniref:Uncharacterized protein n=1 Tax=Candidatus Uhrbacteria bacterium GW2011_GWC1_41_20 TaxID=1618983 RepID=A0A0G0YI11_9BACT|nr:MAG: hypothetical protein UT52_C0001G0040 [Candidatus Uhrbacteria bacterium GW2011_GWE1_39_46]KKR64429.1 MAG: hypothetical protein UU04_C0002G0040 [Candidatus Uhrbacteria bacterium GW2011_GWC2_40_450]KKR90692.1 MAG: hypothetical protein UU40_C0001G0030 [Candidatus Uhrbacteria bacterium GW2011_GWD2_41_121]KKR96591.1 MAG: hypothetical protein UU46_C0001G0040 [Candidatus Uhrbacteria bacterium GW2011_GWD1_41_16]KKR99982.1 MAG: hypothetical protein UU50_C0001G0040 [Candidatus Uhrbacteria bacteriu